MTRALRETLRERVTPRAVGAWVVAVGVLWLVFGSSPIQFGSSIAAMVVFGVVEVLSDAYDLRTPVANVGLGAYAVLSGIGGFAIEDTLVWFPACFIAVGGWYILDGVQTMRHEGATVETEPLDGRQVYHDYVGKQIHEALGDQPRTRRELGDLLDADDDAIDIALRKLLARDVVVRAGSELRVRSTDDPGLPKRAQDRVVGIARRVARPATIEFEEHDADESDHGDADRRVYGRLHENHASTDHATTRSRSEHPATEERDRTHETERESTG